MELSHEANALALAVINDGDGRTFGTPYTRRCELARGMRARLGAMAWLGVACKAATAHERLFPVAEGGFRFTSQDILQCAAELEDYYRRHVAEMDAPKGLTHAG